MEWIELIKYNCTSACSSSVTKPKIKPTETLDDDYHFEPMFKFREAFDVIIIYIRDIRYIRIIKENILIICYIIKELE